MAFYNRGHVQERQYINEYIKQCVQKTSGVLQEHTIHTLMLSIWEEARIRLVNHSPKDFYEEREKQTLIQFIFFAPMYLSLSIPGCFSSQQWVGGCGGLADPGKNGCMASSQHSLSWSGWFRAFTVCSALLVCGNTMKNQKFLILFHKAISGWSSSEDGFHFPFLWTSLTFNIAK